VRPGDEWRIQPGPSSEALARAVDRAVAVVQAAETASGLIPADAASGGGSGLDPHISPEYARLQAPRVAVARGLAEDEVLDLVERLTEGRTLASSESPG